MWLFAFRTEPSATHHALEVRARLHLLQLKYLIAVGSRAEEVLRMFSNEGIKPSHAYRLKLLGG